MFHAILIRHRPQVGYRTDQLAILQRCQAGHAIGDLRLEWSSVRKGEVHVPFF
ncbi:unnamed protein product [Urochloa humidicola]